MSEEQNTEVEDTIISIPLWVVSAVGSVSFGIAGYLLGKRKGA